MLQSSTGNVNAGACRMDVDRLGCNLQDLHNAETPTACFGRTVNALKHRGYTQGTVIDLALPHTFLRNA